jgi:hypothetical protein
MTKDARQTIQDVWKQKSDDELIAASEDFSVYTEEAEEIIRAELRRRRDMPEPEPTVRPIENEPSKQPSLAAKHTMARSKIVVPIGIVIVVIGVALIIISPNLFWQEFEFRTGIVRTTDLRTVTLLFGVALLAVGGIVSAVGLMQFISSQTASRLEPATKSNVAPSVAPKSVALGNTIEEAQSVMGQPDKIIDLGERVIHVYKDLKIIYVGGTVSDVQLS